MIGSSPSQAGNWDRNAWVTRHPMLEPGTGRPSTLLLEGDRRVDHTSRRPDRTHQGRPGGRRDGWAGRRAGPGLPTAGAGGRCPRVAGAARCGGGPDGLVDGHVQVTDGEGEHERHGRRVAGAGVAVDGQGHGGAGVEHPPGVGVGLAGREVGGRQEGGHRRRCRPAPRRRRRSGGCSGRPTRSPARRRAARRGRGRAGWRGAADRGRRPGRPRAPPGTGRRRRRPPRRRRRSSGRGARRPSSIGPQTSAT